jgi:hypothetical protein
MNFRNKINSLFSGLTFDALETIEEKKNTLDKVNHDALEKDFKDRKDKDIDNDGDVDDSDEYLHNRRKTIKKAIAKRSLDEESKTIASMRKIVADKQAMKVDGVMVDMFTASAVTQIYDKVNDANKSKLDGMKASQLANIAYKMMKKEEVELDEKKISKGMQAYIDISNKKADATSKEVKGSIERVAAAMRAKRMKKEDLDENKTKGMTGNYARVMYDYREDYYNITVYKNGKEVASDDGYFGANETGNPLIKKFTDIVKKAGLKPEGLPIVDEDGKKGVFKGKFVWNTKEEVELDEVNDQERLSARKIQRDAQTDRHGIARKPGESMVAYLNRAKKHKEKMQKEEIELDEAKSKEEKIADLEKMLKGISGNTSSVKMKKYAIQKKINDLKNEEVELDEAKLSASQRDRLDDLILNVHMTTHPEYDGGEEPTKYLNMIRKEFGDKVAKQVSDGIEKVHWGRDNESGGVDKLSWRKGNARITKSGKMNAQDVKALKNKIKQDKAWGGITKKVKLPEEVELDESKLNVKAIQKAVDDGKSMDVIMTMFANKRTTNTDEIRKVVKDYMWKKRMKKEELDEAKNYEIKDGKVHISKANFRKVHKDYKNATKGKERMMALDPKTGATTSFPVVFTESDRFENSFRQKFVESLQNRLVEKYAEENGIDINSLTEEELDEVVGKGCWTP